MTTPPDSAERQLRAHVETLDEEQSDLEFLVDELRGYAEQHDLAVAPDEITMIAADVVARTYATQLIEIGYADRDEIVDDVLEWLELDEDEHPMTERVESVVDQLWADRLVEQRSWPEVTDVNRLERAFQRLRESGIVAEENFTCCQGCGVAEIAGEIPEGTVMTGYTFFHQQDTESAVAFGGLHLAYGSFDPEPDEEKQRAVGERVVAALVAEGLATEWTGSTEQRIRVRLNWQNRLPD